MIATKGAPEAIISLCHLDPQEHQRITAQVSAMADKGLRVLGVARAIFNAGTLPATQHDFEFSFLGLVGLEDPVRDDVPQAIAECQAAGIRVVMITGDHPATALSIARQAGLVNDGLTMTGTELSSLSDEALETKLENTQIFCRVQPEQKLRLVQAFRAQGHIVAMTGDGVNDAPALKAAHIGVAMGARGTDVAREAASLVLLKDDFASLVTAVRYGRRVFANLRKAIVFLIAAHVPILGLSIAPVVMGGELILMPVHILFLQLIIDPACSIVFEAEPLEAGAMRVKPRPPSMPLFNREVWMRGLAQGVGLLCILLAMDWGARTHLHPSSDALRTLIFLVLILSNLGLILVSLSWGATRWWDALSRNATFIAMTLATMALLGAVLGIPAIRSLFAFEPLSRPLLAVGAVALVLAVGWFEMVKRLACRQNH